MPGARRRHGVRRPAAGSATHDVIRVLLALHARLDREALAVLLSTQPDLEVVGCAASGDEVVSLCVSSHPSVLILSPLVPWPREVSSVETVRMCCPGTRVLAIAPHTSDRCAQLNPADSGADELPSPSRSCLLSALAHGARGAIDRDAAPEDLFQAVRAVARGERWTGRGIEESRSCAVALTSRERAVSYLIGRGSSNKEIGAALRISEGTVKKHIGHSLRKLSLHDRLQLGLFVVRHPTFFGSR